jgi:hypothetical protein
MGYKTLYKIDFSNAAVWESLLNEFDLPSDTEEVSVKVISHVTLTDYKNSRDKLETLNKK